MATPHFLLTISFVIVFLFSTLSLTLSERCHPDDKRALLKIKKDLNNPYDLISFDPKIDCCDWNAVECDEKTNRIIQFDISQSDLNLPIPDSIGDLPFLQSLSFHHTNMIGPIPKAITRLSKLKFLDLRWNNLTGPVPSFLSQLKELTYIGLSFNNLTGSIPSSLSQLPKLGGLLIDRNKLIGSIPASFGDFKVRDFALYLSHNQLSGPIPSTLAKASFYILDLSRNLLEGDISFFFQYKKILNTADFSRNKFEFNFSNIKVFPKGLVNLDLNHNQIYGNIPQVLTKVDLISFNVSYNRLCGQIPVGGRLQELEYTAYFHNRCLCGAPLPPCK